MRKPTKRQQEIAEQIYQDFCEAEGGVDHPFQEAWNKYQEEVGAIKVGSPVDDLVCQAIVYTIQCLGAGEHTPTWFDLYDIAGFQTYPMYRVIYKSGCPSREISEEEYKWAEQKIKELREHLEE